jgi:NADPH:quinone reductase-like Zn-dependent oxidoreductase
MEQTKLAWQYLNGLGDANLVVVSEENVAPLAGQISIKMAAASLNYRDLVVMDGKHGASVQPPLIPLSDGAGHVVAIGAGVTEFNLGDMVCPLFFPNWVAGTPPTDMHSWMLGGPADGVLTEYFTTDASAVIKAPSNLTTTEAACLPCAGLTAWSALTNPTPIRAGETVLILGTGGVALFALAFARAMGARTIVLTSSDKKIAMLNDLGAQDVVNYKTTPKWSKMIKTMTNSKGVDRVIELGGAETLEQSIRAVRVGGTVVTIGNVTGSLATIPLPLMLTRYINLQAVSVGHKQAFAEMNRAIELNKIKPVIDRVFPFEKAPEAFAYLRAAGHFGKVCVAID